jgi:hypothetical protein
MSGLFVEKRGSSRIWRRRRDHATNLPGNSRRVEGLKLLLVLVLVPRPEFPREGEDEDESASQGGEGFREKETAAVRTLGDY